MFKVIIYTNNIGKEKCEGDFSHCLNWMFENFDTEGDTWQLIEVPDAVELDMNTITLMGSLPHHKL